MTPRGEIENSRAGYTYLTHGRGMPSEAMLDGNGERRQPGAHPYGFDAGGKNVMADGPMRAADESSAGDMLELLSRLHPEWHKWAACHGMADQVFPLRGNGTHIAILARCAVCPVIAECKEAGKDEHYGIWGGERHSEQTRKRSKLRPGETLQDVGAAQQRATSEARAVEAGVLRRRGWTTGKIAAELGITPRQVQRLESRTRQLESSVH